MLYLLVIVIIVAVGLILWLIRMNRKSKKRELQMHIRQVAYYHSLDLHTLFNFLNTLAAFIMTEQPQSAYDFLIAFNKVFKKRLSFEPPLTWSFQRELEFFRTYRQAANLIGTDVPDLKFISEPQSLDSDFEIPALSVYSVYRILTFGRETLPDEVIEVSVYSRKGKYHLTFSCESVRALKDVHQRSEELLMLYSRYYGRNFRFQVWPDQVKAEIQWRS